MLPYGVGERADLERVCESDEPKPTDPPTLSVVDDRLDELSNLSLEVGHGLGVETCELLSTLKRWTVVHTIGAELIAVNAVVPCLTCRMLRLVEYIHAISDSLDCHALDASAVLE